MAGSILNGVMSALSEKFKEGCGVHGAYEAGTKNVPYFLVSVKEADIKPRLSGRCYVSAVIEVSYTASDGEGILTPLSAVGALRDAISYIKLEDGGILRAENTEFEIKRGILHYCARYGRFAKEGEYRGGRENGRCYVKP